MRRAIVLTLLALPAALANAADPALTSAIARDYDSKLKPLFHRVREFAA